MEADSRNQCDGCARGLPQHGGIHYQLRNRGLPVMACSADRYLAASSTPQGAKHTPDQMDKSLPEDGRMDGL